MLTSYLKIAWRSLRKQKVFAAVNIIGMSAAICAALLLSLTAYQEWTYDNFHTNGKDIYQVYREDHTAKGVKEGNSMAEPFAGVLRNEVQGVKYATRFAGEEMPVRYGEKSYYFDVEMVDPDFLQMFTFPLLQGNPREAMKELNQIVISRKTALALFNSPDGVGKTIEVNINNQWRPFIVSAIAADVPDNSSISFEMLTRFENTAMYPEIKGKWNQASYPVFVQVAPAFTAAGLEKSMVPIVHKYYSESIDNMKKGGGIPDKNGEMIVMKTIALKDFYLTPSSTFGSGLNQFYPWLMVILSVMIVGIACINFINLSVAKSFTRGSEIGLRKALGAMDRQLLMQFWSEAFLLCFISLLLSIGLTALLLPAYNSAFGHEVRLTLFSNGWLLLAAAIVFFFITLLAGGYPAWKVARFNIVQILKGKLKLSKSGGIRNGLIVVQFVVAILLISCTVIIWQQLNYIRHTSLGYNTTQVISIPVDNAPPQAITTMRSQLAQLPEVKGVTGSMLNLGLGKDNSRGNSRLGFDYKGRRISTQTIDVDYDYAQTLDLKILEGRDFSRNYGADTTAVVINEQLAKQLDEKEPVGVVMNLSGGPVHIIGVVKDYHFESLHKNIDALMLSMAKPSSLGYIFVKVSAANPVAALKKIEGIWKGINPLVKNDATFLDENANRLYQQEERFSKIFMSGAVLAVVISCMGLFAIAVLIMAQRRKEIGIRKVLGASISGIVLLLSRDFLKLVLVAIVIASPVAWYVMHRWLEGFQFHVSIHWWVFAATGAIAVIIAFVTISTQSVRAALMNPVNSLKSE